MNAPVVVVTGPPFAGASTLVSALRTALPGHRFVEHADEPDAVVFAVSAAAPVVDSDLRVLDDAARRTDLVVGVVTKIDAHADWQTVATGARTAVRGHATRYGSMPWVGVAAAPRAGDPALAELVDLLTSGLDSPTLAQRNRMRAGESALCDQIDALCAPDSVAIALHRRRADTVRTARHLGAAQARDLRTRLQQARIDLNQQVHRRCVDLRAALAQEAARWRRGVDLGAVAGEHVDRVAAEVDAAVTARLREIADDLGLSAPPAETSRVATDPGAPGPAGQDLEARLMIVLGAGFGLGVALAAARLLAGLAPGAATAAAAGGAAVGLLLAAWVVRVRGLLHSRARWDRWTATVTSTLRADLQAAVASRLLSAEAALAAESAAQRERVAAQTHTTLAAIDARLRERAIAMAAAAGPAERRLSALRESLRAVRAQLDSVTAE
ncbi:hypothetical protein QWI29_22890 [Mycolicibacterium neoaurum]|uniref:hypothetical protein n=1 Tax=Mycolicibacterium neoaurum TaxID=1795 RepID=UPI002672E2F7|nr:hypothetical protein [Mycolicibacterium neoaurum]MDO3402896.1 hypothetical protein [Mycolicibacterium neoaurum]